MADIFSTAILIKRLASILFPKAIWQRAAIGMVLMPIGTIVYGALYEKGIYFPVNLFSSIIILVTVFLTLKPFIVAKSAGEYSR